MSPFRIVLINPPRDHLVHLDVRDFVDLGEISSFPPIGLMVLAQALRRKNPRFSVSILDSVVKRMDYAGIGRYVSEQKADLVGITSFTFTFYDVVQTARRIKKVCPSVPVVIGGPHMYTFAQETMTHSCFDYAVVGDGEGPFPELCASVMENRPVPSMPGLLSREEGKVVGSGVAFSRNLDEIEKPALDLIEPHLYYSTLGERKAVGTILSSRGCPFRCTFCQVPKVPYRMRSVENILGEIETYLELGINDFFFFDDLFNITKERIQEFCETVLERRLKISWMFRGRVDQVDHLLMKLSARSGCHAVSVGIEDSTDEGLRWINKKITMRQAYAAVKAIRGNGVKCSANWILGLPHHRTRADLFHLLNTAMDLGTDYAQFSLLQCMPGAALHDQAKAEGGIDGEAWNRYVLEPFPDFSPPIWERYFSRHELLSFYSYCYKRYYLRPSVILREVLSAKSGADLLRKWKTFAEVFLKRRVRRGH